jgi:hypothetical protein
MRILKVGPRVYSGIDRPLLVFRQLVRHGYFFEAIDGEIAIGVSDVVADA